MIMYLPSLDRNAEATEKDAFENNSSYNITKWEPLHQSGGSCAWQSTIFMFFPH
jgi:hypothetical protein